MDSLRIRVLGQLEVQGLIHRDIGSRKGRSLLTALAAARGEPVSADLLAELLWHDQLPANPAEQLQVLVSRLRSSLGIERIERIGSGYRLVYDWLDLDELEQLADESATRLAAGATASARAAATTALRLVRGTPLAEESGAWADTERRRIDRLITSARTTAAESALASGNLLDAIRLAENALEFDRFDEPALRILMLAHVSAGRPAAALAVYATTRERMAEELGVSPTDATESLHSHILLGTVPVPFATASRHDDGLVGREPQLAMLDREFDQAAGGPARLVVISGEPGIGKSALLEAWSERVMVAGALVIGICGDPTGRDLPLQPLFDALATRLQPSGPVASSDEQPQATYLGDQAALRGRLYLDILEQFRQIASTRPLVLTVDDAQDVDQSTINWMQFAIKRSTALLVVLTVRTPIRAALGPDLSPTTIIELGPLDLTAAEHLVGQSQAATNYERSGGNPLYLIELARSPAGVIPAAVLDNARERADSLGEAALTVRTAAVLGIEVDIDLVAVCVSRPVRLVLDDLEAAVAAHLLIESGIGFAFVHDLVREALAQTLTSARRAFVHREATHALRNRGAARPSRTAFHARRGGATATAAAALVEGAAIAADRFELGVAERLLDESIQLLASRAGRLARAKVRMARSDHDGAATDLADLVGPGADAAVFELAGWVAYYRRDFATARQCADESLRLAPSAEIRSSAEALGGRIRHSRGELTDALVHLERCVARPGAASTSVGRVWLGALQVHLGSFDAAQVTLAAFDASKTITHPFAVAHAWLSRCMACGLSGELEQAFAAVTELDSVVTTQGAQGGRFQSIAFNLRAWLLRSVGHNDHADELNRRALDVAVPGLGGLGAAFEEPFAHARLDLAEGCLRRYDIATARWWIDEAKRGANEASTMAWHIEQRSMWLRGRLALADGRRDEALHLGERLVADATERGSRRYAVLGRHLATVAAPLHAEHADSLLRDLDYQAPLDAWWLTLDLANATGQAHLVPLARSSADRLVLEAARCPTVDIVQTERWIGRRFDHAAERLPDAT